MNRCYPSDISREQCFKIKPLLESAPKKTRARTIDLYDVFCGVLSVLKSGCQWRMLQKDYPAWRTCYEYFRKWSEQPDAGSGSILEQVLKKIGWRDSTKQWSERENVTDSAHSYKPPWRPCCSTQILSYRHIRAGSALLAPCPEA